TTPHFAVSFPEGYGHIALRTAQLAEEARPYMVARYDWEPAGRISIVLNDQTDYANGSATIVPNKVITIYVTAPTRVSGLEEYDDWLATVLIHEMSHIFHLDMAYGLPWLGRFVFGKYISMNAYSQAWVTEGLAVYEETVSTGTGRGRSSYVQMVLRAAALEDRFPPIDQGYRGYPDWPFSNVAYFFGGRFQLWLAEHYGEEKLMAYHRAYAANPIPFFTYLPAKLVFDTSLESLWLAFEEDVRAEAARDLSLIEGSTLAVTRPERLTTFGGQSVGPRVTPDGEYVVFSTSSPVDGPRVRRMRLDGTAQEVLLNDTLSEGVSFTPDGAAFFYQQAEINQRFYNHNNLFRYDVAKDEAKRVTLADEADEAEYLAPSGSLRARDPDVAPDGARIVFVQSPYGANRLVLAELVEGGEKVRPHVMVPAEPDVQLANPRFSPDGQRVAVSRFAGGRRDVVIYDLEGRLVREITRDRAQDTDPTWSPDGRWVVFSSDRSGVYNLWAYDVEQDELRQLTNLVNGAFQPDVTKDGRAVIFRGYTAEGFDVFRVPFAPEAGLVVARALEPEVALDTEERRWPPRHAGAPIIPPPAPFKGTPMPTELPEGWSIDDYSPLSTLLPFHDNWNLFPAFNANEQEIFFSLLHFGTDARYTHTYFLNGTYGTFTNFFGGAAGYTYDALEPTFSVAGFADAVAYNTRVFVPAAGGCPYGGDVSVVNVTQADGSVVPTSVCKGSRNGRYNERRLSARLSVGLPVLQRHLLSMSYVFEHRQSLDPVADDALISGGLPRSGRFARLSLGYTYANVRAFPYSISLQRGPTFGAAVSALSKGLGGDYEQILITSEGRYYVDMPWRTPGFTNHVLATRLGIGAGFGPDLAQLFRLGGVAGRSAITTTTDDFYALRGFVTSGLTGVGVISGSTEYRAPLFRVDRGIGTLPFVLRVVHAAVFADYGRVFDKISWDDLKAGWQSNLAVGVGAELRADVILFYGLPITARVGYAYPVVAPDPILLSTGELFDPKSPGFYFQLGSLY
ncbi:MAG: PD40 domain-containing protein, partial [Myxococcales bacterium]|nr:PD40 domain-containing protein [Myxococcales bacterium]